jgi:hypothetical protein
MLLLDRFLIRLFKIIMRNRKSPNNLKVLSGEIRLIVLQDLFGLRHNAINRRVGSLKILIKKIL